jgi:hypothetical protein
MAFGTKRNSDWTGQDNATHAVATMLSAEMKQKRERDASRRGMTIAALAGFVIAIAYCVADLVVF